jgi:hypothetical protein
MKFRPQANQIEALTKRNNWASLAIVGVSDADVLQRMLFACTRLAITVVATWPAKSTQPGERIKQTTRADKVRHLSRSYASRVTLLECTAGEAAHKLAGQEFDGAVLFDAPDLERDGGAWALLVRSGGMLLGTDHRDIATRAVLNAVAPGWERLDDGLWCVRVKRAEISGVAGDDSAVDDSPADAPVGLALAELAPAVASANVHDPVNSGPAVDDAVHNAAPDVAGAEGEGLVVEQGESGHLARADVVPAGDGAVAGQVIPKVDRIADTPARPKNSGKRRANTNVAAKGSTALSPLTPEIAGADVHEPTIAPKRRGRPAKKKTGTEV